MAYPYIMLNNALSITIDGRQYVVNKQHPNFHSIIQAVKSKAWDTIQDLINIPKTIEKKSGNAVTITNGLLYYKGLPVHSYLAKRIIDLFREGFDIEPWTLFMDKLYSNPDPNSIIQLYPFLERAQLPICPDGDFLGYKYVRDDYYDCHTGTMYNGIGATPYLDRAICDSNPDNHCSSGLHFCAREYLPSYGNGQGIRVVIVKVNPANVVSVPNDHNFAKARCCTYEVVGEIDKDYSIEDLQNNAVLPPPRDNKAVNKVKKKVVSGKGPSELVKRILRSSAGTVRECAKNLGITQADIVNNAGEYYSVHHNDGKCLGDAKLYFTSKGINWLNKNRA